MSLRVLQPNWGQGEVNPFLANFSIKKSWTSLRQCFRFCFELFLQHLLQLVSLSFIFWMFYFEHRKAALDRDAWEWKESGRERERERERERVENEREMRLEGEIFLQPCFNEVHVAAFLSTFNDESFGLISVVIVDVDVDVDVKSRRKV